MPRGRASDYSVEEVLHFLNLMEEILPIGSQEWDQLLQLHLVDFPTTGRTVDSLRRKYASLHRKKIPTGDPECPVEVKKAKRVKRLIGIKADLGCGEEEMDITDGALIGPNDSEEPTSNNESTETEGDVESDDVPLNENTNVPFVTPAASVTPLVAPPAADAVAAFANGGGAGASKIGYGGPSTIDDDGVGNGGRFPESSKYLNGDST